MTVRPLIAEILDQRAPAFGPAHDALQWLPATVVTTVSRDEVPRRTLTVLDVEGPVRRFTPAHAGTLVVLVGVEVGAGGVTGGGGVTGAGMDDPPSANRHAKYVFVVPGTVAVPQPNRW